MTDFENAAFAIFIVLITRAILSFDLNFYLPIPRTTENMENAHNRDAVSNDKFYFRRDPFQPPAGSPERHNSAEETQVNGVNHSSTEPPLGPVEDEYMLMSIDEIINGQKDSADQAQESFPGLIPLVESYLDSVNVDVETRCELARYLDLISKRAKGELWTGAEWMRHFVRKHPEYKMDSKVGQGITYDLCKAVEKIAGGGKNEGLGKEMLGGRS